MEAVSLAIVQQETLLLIWRSAQYATLFRSLPHTFESEWGIRLSVRMNWGLRLVRSHRVSAWLNCCLLHGGCWPRGSLFAVVRQISKSSKYSTVLLPCLNCYLFQKRLRESAPFPLLDLIICGTYRLCHHWIRLHWLSFLFQKSADFIDTIFSKTAAIIKDTRATKHTKKRKAVQPEINRILFVISARLRKNPPKLIVLTW